MKKLFAFIFSMILLSSLFATTYTVKTVTGKAKYKVDGVYKEIKAGSVIEGETEINIGINSGMELIREDGKYIKIGSTRIGTLDNICIDVLGTKTGLNKKRTIARADIAAPVDRPREAVATAASRASEAKEDFIWDAGEEE